MESEKRLYEYKKEFADEIDSCKVSVDSLKSFKVSDDVLAAEVYLRKKFGDEFFVKDTKEEKIEGEKEVIKLDEADIEFDSKVRSICDNIADENFDNNIGVILAKIGQEDE